MEISYHKKQESHPDDVDPFHDFQWYSTWEPWSVKTHLLIFYFQEQVHRNRLVKYRNQADSLLLSL